MKNSKFYEYNQKTCIFSLISGDNDNVKNCVSDSLNELCASNSEGATEKHLPQITMDNNIVKVQIGSISHPMTDEHSINWIYLETSQGHQLKYLSPDQKPEAEFLLTANDKPIAAYAYCNLHGFWRTEFTSN